MRKKLILIILLIAVLLGGIYIAYAKGLIFKSQGEPDNQIEQNSGDVIQNNTQNSGEANQETESIVHIQGTKIINDIEITNIQIKLVEKKKCEFTADVKNTTDQYKEATNLRIKVINASGETDEIFGGVITELAAYEPNKFKTIVLADITDAKDIEFEAIN